MGQWTNKLKEMDAVFFEMSEKLHNEAIIFLAEKILSFGYSHVTVSHFSDHAVSRIYQSNNSLLSVDESVEYKVIRDVFLKNSTVKIENLHMDLAPEKEWKYEAEKIGAFSFVSIPVTKHESVLYAINIYSPRNVFEVTEVEMISKNIDSVFTNLFNCSDTRQTEVYNKLDNISELLFNTLPMGLALCTLSGKLIYVNDAFGAIIDYSIDECKQFSYWDITPEKYEKEESEQLEILLSVGQTGPYEKEYRHRNGTLIPVRLYAKLLTIGSDKFIWSSVEDISQEKEIETTLVKKSEELEQSEHIIKLSELKLKEASRIAKVGYWDLNVDQNILTWSEQLYKTLEIDPNIVKPSYQSYISCVHPEERDLFAQSFHGFNDKQDSFELEYRVVMPDGRIKFIEEKRQMKFDDTGKSSAIIGVVVDVTEQKKYGLELMKAKEKAEESNRLKTEFLENLSHEIRTPMTGIVGFSQFIQKNDLSRAKIEEYTNIIVTSSNLLLHTIDDILEISALSTNQTPVKNKECSVCEIIDTVVEAFQQISNFKGIKLIVSIDKSAPDVVVVSDHVRVQTILKNIVDNAFKFTVSGSVTIGFTTTDESISIFVTDTGKGIPEDEQQNIFTKFYQIEKSLSTKVGGLGLGLSIAYESALLVDGKLSVSSMVGAGSTFTLTLPHKRDVSDSMSEKVVRQPHKDEKLTFLIVEDNEINAVYLSTILQHYFKADTKILLAINGQDAVEICESNPDISLIMMDIKMPIMNGIDATKKIREHFSMPIVIQTAFLEQSEFEEAHVAGCDAYITKPIEEQKLIETVKMLLGLE